MSFIVVQNDSGLCANHQHSVGDQAGLSKRLAFVGVRLRWECSAQLVVGCGGAVAVDVLSHVSDCVIISHFQQDRSLSRVALYLQRGNVVRCNRVITVIPGLESLKSCSASQHNICALLCFGTLQQVQTKHAISMPS